MHEWPQSGVNQRARTPRKPRPHGAVLAWLKSVDDASLHLATVTLGEIQAGMELTREQDAEKAADIEDWLDRQGAWPHRRNAQRR